MPDHRNPFEELEPVYEQNNTTDPELQSDERMENVLAEICPQQLDLSLPLNANSNDAKIVLNGQELKSCVSSVTVRAGANGYTNAVLEIQSDVVLEAVSDVVLVTDFSEDKRDIFGSMLQCAMQAVADKNQCHIRDLEWDYMGDVAEKFTLAVYNYRHSLLNRIHTNDS
ncbi:MAG: hypothetical protein GY941_21005 [Planctomycetes bacterium]|nr:hypothetical protein [Planctomycetota bacterium]